MIAILKKLSVPVFSFLALAALAGPIPFTQNQFPVWYATQTTQQQAISNANEAVLFQTSVPLFAVGNQGFMRITKFVGSPDAAAATVTHVFKTYLGGTNTALGGTWSTTGAVAIETNTTTTTTSSGIVSYLLPNNNALTNFYWGTTTTNTVAAPDSLATGRRQVTYGTQTNGILLTVTGQAAGTGGSTNIVDLDGIVIEALGVQ